MNVPYVNTRSLGFLLGLSALMLGANFVWVSYNNVLLPTMVERAVTDWRGPIVGLIGFMGSMVGIIVSLLAGLVSDRTTHRWGKRTPGILFGAFLGLPVIVLGALCHPPVLPVIVGSFVGMQFFTNVSNGAWWPLLVDVVPEGQRGLASGLQGLFTLLGAALGMGLVTWLNEVGQTTLALWLIGLVFAATGVITSLTIRGHDLPASAPQPVHLHTLLKEMFHVRTRVTVFFWVVFGALLGNMGLTSMQFFARFFFEVYFPAVNPDRALRLMGLLSLVWTMLSAVTCGLISDRVGRRRLILAGLVLSAITTLAMGLASDFTLFLLLATLRAAAAGPLVAVVPALASGLAPPEEAGQYMAYHNLSTGLASALASLFFGFTLASMNRAGFMTLFVASALLFLAGGLVFHFEVPQEELDRILLTANHGQ